MTRGRGVTASVEVGSEIELPSVSRPAALEAGIDLALLGALFERAATAVAAYQGPEHVCIYLNPVLARLSRGRPLLGMPLRETLAEAQIDEALERFERVYRSGAPVTLPRLGAHLHPWLTASGAVGGVLSIAGAADEAARTEPPDDTLARLNFALEAAHAGTWQWDVVTGEVQWSDNLEAIHGLPPGSFGGDFRSFLEDVDPRDRNTVLARIQSVIERGGDYHVEYRLAGGGGGERWVEGKGRMLLDEQGRPLRMTGVCMDVTPRKQAERRLDLALQELRHRVKNMLAVVSSVSAQTLRHAGSLADFDRAFQGRLAGLAGAHDLLVDAHWEGASLRALVTAQLSPWLGQRDRLKLEGDDVSLPANVALALGMTLHELATNAAKYGALSTESGAVEVSWRPEPAGAGRQLVLLWEKSGGPPVAPPARRSFGAELIEGGIAYEIAGEVRLEFPPQGVRCELRFPLARG
jgi:PAS domain S-box-containing protein